MRRFYRQALPLFACLIFLVDPVEGAEQESRKTLSTFISHVYDRIAKVESIFVQSDVTVNILPAAGEAGGEFAAQLRYYFKGEKWAYYHQADKELGGLDYIISWNGGRYHWGDKNAGSLRFSAQVPREANPLAFSVPALLDVNSLFGDTVVFQIEGQSTASERLSLEQLGLDDMHFIANESLPKVAVEQLSVSFEQNVKEVVWFEKKGVECDGINSNILVAFDGLKSIPFCFIYLNSQTNSLIQVRHLHHGNSGWVEEAKMLMYGPNLNILVDIGIVNSIEKTVSNSSVFSPDPLIFETVYDETADMFVDPLAFEE